MGMLITRKAEKLQSFNSFKKFEKAARVKGQKEMTFYKLENPQHTVSTS